MVLAGGKSSRMGRNKALLSWQGKPLYRHMADMLSRAGVSDILFSSNELTGVTFLADIIPDRGPLSGIHAALNELPNSVHLIIVPVDMPLLPAEACQQLLDSAGSVPVCYQNYTLPMVLPVTEALREQVSKAIESDNHRDYSLRNLHRALSGEYLPLGQGYAELFQNTNTPEDWQQALVRSESNNVPAEQEA